MSVPRKITLQEAADSGAVALLIYCTAGRAHYGGCFHWARIELWLALRRWRSHRRLDELRLRCTRCGARGPDVRPDYIKGNDGADARREAYLDHWRSRRQ